MTGASGALVHEVKPGAQHIALSGVLTMDNVGAMYRNLRPFEAGARLTLDVSGVTKADSSALALVTALVRGARAQKMRVVLQPLPRALSPIIELYGLHDILSSCAA
jgi:phospholipid transport system transporter-binding protein